MIEFNDVSKSYGKQKYAIRDLNLKINPGELLGLLGPNGAGKTTTLKMLTGIAKPDQGKILINGHNISTHPLEAKKQFGYVPDNHDIFLQVKGISYLNFMADIYEVSSVARRAIIQDLSVRFGMNQYLQQPIKSYSHGMKQKILIIGALIHSPKVLILDEPMTGLDPQAMYELKKLMKKHVQQGNSVFFSTHVLDVAENLCDLIAVLDKGELLFSGTIKELRQKFNSNKTLEQIFLKITTPEFKDTSNTEEV
ncbi:ABC transporter ATP-binding protein [Paenibacillus sp. CMAA1739]|uniref:ABC transporter ATP-binding protein n=1 Tax=Paenibacillus TaxID=44249 RepID=UPI0027313807|nr:MULTISPECIES: ABC transporter ATP-binding protein [Paenibacillus]MDP1510558.1 ABC transporter ATP-binding protein [Paenibacillus ottowii]MEC4565972.1 ABC transporter ATP-binding protein [Paenibacillus sp. CMAA1739]